MSLPLSSSFTSKDFWFTENAMSNSDLIKMSTKMNAVIEKRKSKYQDILVLQK